MARSDYAAYHFSVNKFAVAYSTRNKTLQPE